jgi:pimeloyl-ACP methyl ester carboxylesterase
MRRTRFVELLIRAALSDRSAMSSEEVAWFADSFRDPIVAGTATNTYRTFWLREISKRRREPEQRRSTVPTRCLFGVEDAAIHVSLAAEETANADDYRLVRVPGCGHFLPDERPDLLREHLVELARSQAAAPA